MRQSQWAIPGLDRGRAGGVIHAANLELAGISNWLGTHAKSFRYKSGGL